MGRTKHLEPFAECDWESPRFICSREHPAYLNGGNHTFDRLVRYLCHLDMRMITYLQRYDLFPFGIGCSSKRILLTLFSPIWYRPWMKIIIRSPVHWRVQCPTQLQLCPVTLSSSIFEFGRAAIFALAIHSAPNSGSTAIPASFKFTKSSANTTETLGRGGVYTVNVGSDCSKRIAMYFYQHSVMKPESKPSIRNHTALVR